MKKKLAAVLAAAFVLACFVGVAPQSAEAVPPFKMAWDAKYKSNEKLSAAAAEAKCNVCHVGTSKKDKNAYGNALAKHIKKTDGKDTDKINKALEDVEKEASNGDGSPTFGDLFKEGKLVTE